MSQTTLEFDSVWHRWKAENASARRKEVSRVVVCVETDEIAVKDAEENFSSNRQNSDPFELVTHKVMTRRHIHL